MSTNRINYGWPAFPTIEEHGFNSGEPGMTLRDYFAAKAMEGICASGPSNEWTNTRIGEEAYALADAMMKARDSIQESKS